MGRKDGIDFVFLLADFEGRIPRREFWAGLAAACGLLAGLTLALLTAAHLAPSAAPMLTKAGWAAAGLFLFPLAALATKRWHDRNKSGGRSLVVLIPVAGLAYLIYELGFVPGMSERLAAPRRVRATA